VCSCCASVRQASSSLASRLRVRNACRAGKESTSLRARRTALIARFSPRPAPSPGCILPLCLPHTYSLSHSLPGRSQLPRRRQIRAESRGLGVDDRNKRRRHDLQDFCLPRRPCPRQDQQHPDSGQLRAVPRDRTTCIQSRRRQVDSWQGFHGTRQFLQALPFALRYVMLVRLSPVAHTILQLCPLTHARTQHAKRTTTRNGRKRKMHRRH